MNPISQSKAWLNPFGESTWISGHIQGASEILRRTFRGCGIEAYDIMFSAGHIRIQIDGYDLFFNFGGDLPNQDQLKWLRETAPYRHLILVNGDTGKEVDLESESYREIDGGDNAEERCGRNQENKDYEGLEQNL